MNHAWLVVGLGYGDEGKGSIVDYLCRIHPVSCVVRFNGGPQAAHNVIAPDGRHHTFAQFGSGMFVDGVQTYLSRHTLINPIDMMAEELHLASIGIEDAWYRMFIDKDCVIITPFQRAANRLLEISRGEDRHGSCGQGVGEARADQLELGVSLLLRDLQNHTAMIGKLIRLQTINRAKIDKVIDKLPQTEQVETELRILDDLQAVDWTAKKYETFTTKPWLSGLADFERESFDHVVFEGAQGVLLDETYGEAPYNTWTDTTFNNAETVMDEWRYTGTETRIGVIRTYMTRHGVGPLATEDPTLEKMYSEKHNSTGVYQGGFRFGGFDYQAIQRAIEICGEVDEIALNHLDQTADINPNQVESAFEIPVTILGYGPRATDKRIRVPLLNGKPAEVEVSQMSDTVTPEMC